MYHSKLLSIFLEGYSNICTEINVVILWN